MYTATTNDIKKFAQQIEDLAHDVQAQINRGDDYILTANELVRTTSTLVFTLGEVHALEQSGLNKLTQAVQSMAARKTTSVPAARTYSNNHNVRAANGRFARR